MQHSSLISYIHHSYRTHSQRFLRNEPNLLFDLNAYGADVFFNPDFTEIDRVLDVRIVPKSQTTTVIVENNEDIDALLDETEYGEHGEYMKEFRIKWCGLPYKDLSWEVFDDFKNSAAIVEYYNHL